LPMDQPKRRYRLGYPKLRLHVIVGSESKQKLLPSKLGCYRQGTAVSRMETRKTAGGDAASCSFAMELQKNNQRKRC